MSARRRLAALMGSSQASPDLVFHTGTGPLPWSLPTLPTGWIWADGSVLLSSTPYTALRAAYIASGFPYGQDGSGNPKVPDMRGRVPGGKDDMGGTAASRLTTAGSGVDGATLGAAGGAETHTLTVPQMPAHTHDGNGMTNRNTSTGGSDQVLIKNATANALAPAVNSTGGGSAHNNTQPTLVVGYIVKT